MQAQFINSQALTANQSGYDPISTWQNRYLPYDAEVQLFIRATTTGTRLSLNSGSRTIAQRQPIQGGGTAGVTPSQLNTNPVVFIGYAGELLQTLVDEVAGGTPTVDTLIVINQLA
jgi:hypothetical protein